MPKTRTYYLTRKKKNKSQIVVTMDQMLGKIKAHWRHPLREHPRSMARKLLPKLRKIQPIHTTSANGANSKQLVQIEIPSQVSLVVGEDNKILVTGIRGSLIHTFEPTLSFEKKDNLLFVSSTQETTTTAFSTQTGILYRMLVGVTRGYKEKVKTSGVGYRAVLEEKQLLTLFLGYSHRAHHRLLPNVNAKFGRKNNKINFSGPSWPAVSATAAEVHHLKKPDVYNGKGVRYRGLKLRKKEGKKQGR